MNISGLSQLESAFEAASCMDPGEQEEFLRRIDREQAGVAATLRGMLECSDDRIEEEIRELVSAVASEAAPEMMIGPYRLLGVIGEGGFGVVNLAEQVGTLARLVALKVIKPGMDTRQVLARFDGERRSLALMDHPAVVSALDAGTTPDGRPYVVMPLVPGLSISDYCNDASLTPGARMKLLAEVCRGVQHAHGRGVLHRDLKPSNILVATVDGRAHARVIDFGLAKALTDPLRPGTTLTLDGQLIGTPEYMAPEQALGNVPDVRADVYALGAIGYELLTGRPPLTEQELRAGGRDGLVRALQERTPDAPSRHTPGLAHELDWIILACLEKDPARRYATAEALAADLERFCEGRSVSAGPPARLYRLWRTVVRHRWSIGAATVAAAGLIGGAVASTAFAVRAERDRSRAEQVTSVTRSILTSVSPTVAQGRDPELLLAMLDAGRHLADEPGLDPAVERDVCETFALAYQAVARYAEATRYAQRADDLIRRLDGPDATRRLAMLNILLRGRTFQAMDGADRGAAERRISAEMRRVASAGAPGDEATRLRTELNVQRLSPAFTGRDDEGLRAFAAECEREFGPNSAEAIAVLRLLSTRMADQFLPGAYEVAEEARRRSVVAFGAESAQTHEGVVLELRAAGLAGVPAARVYEMGLERIPAAERVLGWRSRVVVTAWQNHALTALGLGKCDEALAAFQSALRGERAVRGESSGMAQWIAGNLAMAALRCDRWDVYAQTEEQMWRIEPGGPHPAWESIVEIIDLLNKRGEHDRARRWLGALERNEPEKAAEVRRRMPGAPSPARERDDAPQP